MQRPNATNGCNDVMPQKICQCPQGIAHDGCRRYYLRSEETHKVIQARLTYLCKCLNSMLKLGQTFATDATSSVATPCGRHCLAHNFDQIESILAVRRDTKAATKTISGIEANESKQVMKRHSYASYRLCAPTCGTAILHRSSKTLLADDTALRRIVIRTSKSAPQTTVLDHFHLHMRVSPQWQAILPQ